VVSTTTGVEGSKGLEAKVAREPPEAETSSGVLAVPGEEQLDLRLQSASFLR
jgi:hypothetical protein